MVFHRAGIVLSERVRRWWRPQSPVNYKATTLFAWMTAMQLRLWAASS